MTKKNKTSQSKYGRLMTPTSSTVCPDFDVDIITEILLRLPAKSLLRFRCVSKSWLALISVDPSFVQNHLRRVNANNNRFNVILGTDHSKASILSTVDDKGDISITELDYPVDWCHYDVFYPKFYGSCNGLVCLEFENGDFIIWNPCTREFKQLPQPELHVGEHMADDYVHLAGFGYDSTVADYKVVRATSIYNTEPVNLQVLTLKTSAWRTVQDFNHVGEGTRSWGYNCTQPTQGAHGFLLNETLHWVGQGEADLRIVTFGLADETCQVMAVFLYSCSLNHRSFPPTSLVKVGNSLLVYHELGIYKMKEYGVQESWTRVIYISPDDLPEVPEQDPDYFNLRAISMLENGEALVNHRGSVWVYNPEEKTFRCVLRDDYVDYYSGIASYVETLVSPLSLSPVVGIRVGTAEYNAALREKFLTFLRIRKEKKRKKVMSLKLPAVQSWSRKGHARPTIPTSGTVCPDFDDDIITEILLRLPAKSLLRFRCVSKSWLALISVDPSFVQNHLRRINANNNRFNVILGTHPSKACVLSTVDDKGDVGITEFNYPVDWWHSDGLFPRFYGSCNGLMCLEFDNGNMIIWNPCTREFKQLPQPVLHIGENGGDNFVYLAGFGYDSTIADYKVIRAAIVYHTEPIKLQVLTLKTGSWRTVQDFNHRHEAEGTRGYNCNPEAHGFLLNETLHWVTVLRGPKYDGEGQGSLGIVAFGLAEETFQVMAVFPYPRLTVYRPLSISIVAVPNSLFVYHEFGIYTMKEYGVQESWTTVMNISPEDLPPDDCFSLRVICILENGEALVFHRGSVGIYNPEEKTFRYVLKDCLDFYSQSATYVETLVSPEVGTGAVKNNASRNLSSFKIRKEKKCKKVLSLKQPAVQSWSRKGHRASRQLRGNGKSKKPN